MKRIEKKNIRKLQKLFRKIIPEMCEVSLGTGAFIKVKCDGELKALRGYKWYYYVAPDVKNPVKMISLIGVIEPLPTASILGTRQVAEFLGWDSVPLLNLRGLVPIEKMKRFIMEGAVEKFDDVFQGVIDNAYTDIRIAE